MTTEPTAADDEHADTTTLPSVSLPPDLARKLRTAAEKVEQWTADRDRLIIEARRAGGTLREIAALANLTDAGVSYIEHGKKRKG